MPLLSFEVATYVLCVCLCARLCPPSRRIALLSAASYGFAALVDLRLVGILLTFTAVNGALLVWLERERRRWLLSLIVLANLGFWLVLQSLVPEVPRYADPRTATLFERFAPEIDPLFGIGASFYVVQAIDCAVAVYRGELRSVGFLEYSLLLGFFPKLLAGPLVGSRAFMDRLRTPSDAWDVSRLGRGCRRVLVGTFLKLAVANRIGAFSDPVLTPGFEGAVLLAATYLLAAQLAFDLLGYLAIAKGLADIVGLPFDEGGPQRGRPWEFFLKPWYPTLVGWFQDAIYEPLLARGLPRSLALVGVFVAIGIWHRPTVDFVCIGAYFGCLQLCVNGFGWAERRMDRSVRWCARLGGWLVGLHAVVLGLLAVRLESIGATWDACLRMARGVRAIIDNLEHIGRGHGVVGPLPEIVIEGQMFFPILTLGLLAVVGVLLRGTSLEAWFLVRPSWMRSLILGGLAMGVAIFGRGGDIPFLYFRF